MNMNADEAWGLVMRHFHPMEAIIGRDEWTASFAREVFQEFYAGSPETDDLVRQVVSPEVFQTTRGNAGNAAAAAHQVIAGCWEYGMKSAIRSREQAQNGERLAEAEQNLQRVLEGVRKEGVRKRRREPEAVQTDTFSEFGFPSPRSPSEVDRIKLAGAFLDREKMIQISGLARMISVMGRGMKKTGDGWEKSDTPTSLTLGNELSDIITQEWGLFASPETEPLFLKQFAEESLMVYERNEYTIGKRGPVIAVLDSSGSMANIERIQGQWVSREVLTKAIALNMLQLAKEAQRDFAMVHFAGPGEYRVFEFKDGQARESEVAEALSLFLCSGTRYEDWMRESIRLVDTNRFDSADVVVMTDGLAVVDTDQATKFNRLRETRGVKVHACLIGMRRPGGMKEISDEIIFVNNNNNGKLIELVFNL